MAKKVKLDAWQKFQNPLLTQYNIEQLVELKRSNWSGLLLGIDQLYSTMYHEWDVLQKDCNDIAAAVRTLEWSVVPAMKDGEEADERAQEVANVVQEALWRRAEVPIGGHGHSFLQLIEAMVHGVFRGYNVHQVEWANDGELVYPARYVQLPPQFLRWETETGKPDRLLLVPDGQGAEAVPFTDGLFVVALNNCGPDHPVYNATFYSLVNWFLAYKFGLGWFMQFAQRFGMPKQVFKYASERDKEQLLAEMEDERALNTIFLKGDRKYEIVNPPQGGANLPQAVLVQRAEEACHKAILGQTLTSDTSAHGGSLAQAQVHAGVRAEVVLHKAEFVAEVLNTQLVPAIVRANFGRVEGLPMPELRCKLPQVHQNADVLGYWKLVKEMGIPFKKSEFHESTGIGMPGEGDEVYGGEQQQGHGHGMPGMGGGAKKQAEPDEEPEPEPPGGGDGVKAARAARRDVAQVWLEPLKERLRAARARGASLEELREEAKGWRLDTVALAADMAANVRKGLLGAGDAVQAANPYGCNQYGEGWAEEHNGNSTKYETTGFSGKQSKMLTHEADGNKVSVATKEKRPGKGAYPDASNEGLEKAAESADVAKEAKLNKQMANSIKHIGVIEGLLNTANKTFAEYGDKDGQLYILEQKDDLKGFEYLLKGADTAEKKQDVLNKFDSYLKNVTKELSDKLKNAKNKKADTSAVKMQQDFTVKKAEVLDGLEKGIKKVEEAIAEAKKQNDAFGIEHLTAAVLPGLKHWMENVKKNNEVTADNFMKLKAHGEMVTKLLRKADSDIEVIQEDYKKGDKGVPAPPKKDDVGIPAPPKKVDVPAVGGKGIKADLLKLPDNKGDAIFKLVQEVETAGDKAAAKVWGKLKEVERNAITGYTGSKFASINASFRADAPTPAAKRLEKVLNKMELGMDVTVTRCEGVYGLAGVLPEGVSLYSNEGLKAAAEWLNKQAEAGKGVVRPNKAPMSTSLAKGAFGKNKVVRIIDLPKGTKGGCIANYSQFKSEREFLVAPGTKTRIIGAEVHDGYIFIREEVVK